MGELSLGYEWESYSENREIEMFHIQICRRVVQSKELLYLVLLHELSHFITTFKSVCEHYYSVNAFLNVLE